MISVLWLAPAGTWRAIMFLSSWRENVSHPPTPPPLTLMRINRRSHMLCRSLKVCAAADQLIDQICYLSKQHKKFFWGFHTFSCELLILYLSQPSLKCRCLICSCCSLFSLAEPTLSKDQSRISALNHPHKKTSDPATAVVGTSMPLPVPNKPESVVSITSQCSYSSTIVHVGDKKPHPESGTVERKTSSQNLSITQHVYTKHFWWQRQRMSICWWCNK